MIWIYVDENRNIHKDSGKIGVKRQLTIRILLVLIWLKIGPLSKTFNDKKIVIFI
jgi:hypothetical protein